MNHPDILLEGASGCLIWAAVSLAAFFRINFALGLKPIVQILPVLASPGLINLVRPPRNPIEAPRRWPAVFGDGGTSFV
jgi:hypothetical protein